MIKAAENHLDGLAEWYSPRAGLFLWIKLNGIEDTSALIEEKARNANGKIIFFLNKFIKLKIQYNSLKTKINFSFTMSWELFCSG